MKIGIIGAGFGGLSAAALLAKDGHEVEVFEQLDQSGGKATLYKTKGFTFDMGPSWYLMPDVFEWFFGEFGKKPQDYYTLTKLSPQYRVYFPDGKQVDVEPDLHKTMTYFESVEPGAGKQLERYLDQSKQKYDIALSKFLYRNIDSIGDVWSVQNVRDGLKLNLFQSMEAYISRFFTHEKLKQILMYNLVFLGGSPTITPALYSLMAHVDFGLGVYYPQGGFHQVAVGMEEVGKELGVKYHYQTQVTGIKTEGEKVGGVEVRGKLQEFDAVVSGADYVYTESLLDVPAKANYTWRYWQNRTMAPSAFLMYLGIKGTLNELTHHTLVFGADWRGHFSDIFNQPAWPKAPSLYLCNPNKTESALAPKGHENLFVLVPVATTLNDSAKKREEYADYIVKYLEQRLKVSLSDRMVSRRVFSMQDYAKWYHSYSGSAFGLAHTLRQTAFFRPKNYNSQLKNLYYCGQMTQPGIGVPICIISGELVRQRIKERQR